MLQLVPGHHLPLRVIQSGFRAGFLPPSHEVIQGIKDHLEAALEHLTKAPASGLSSAPDAPGHLPFLEPLVGFAGIIFPLQAADRLTEDLHQGAITLLHVSNAGEQGGKRCVCVPVMALIDELTCSNIPLIDVTGVTGATREGAGVVVALSHTEPSF